MPQNTMYSAKISEVHFPLMTRFCRDRDVDGGAALVQGSLDTRVPPRCCPTGLCKRTKTFCVCPLQHGSHLSVWPLGIRSVAGAIEKQNLNFI